MRLFPHFNIFVVKTLFAALLFLLLSMFFGTILLPWLYLPIVAFLYYRRLFKLAVWSYTSLLIIALLQMLIVSSIYPKHYPADTDVLIYGGLPIAPAFVYQLDLQPECLSTTGQQFCGYQLSQWVPMSPAAQCTLRAEPAMNQTWSIRANAALCLLTRIPPQPATTAPAVIINVENDIYTLHTAFIISVAVLFACLLLLNNIRQSYRTP